jgi:L-aminopeptidase/D-esterase-like protein
MRTVLPALSKTVIAFAALVTTSSPTHGDQSDLIVNTDIHGPVLSFDWPAIEIGIGSYEEGPTGLTIFRFRNRASATVDVRGGAVGTVNTDMLRLGYGRAFIDAIVFSGGSAYGEEAIASVATGLKDGGVRSGQWGNIAIVSGAIIYDFGSRRINEIYPDKRLAQAALHTLRRGVFPLGAQGAGRMAMQGEFFGCYTHSGQGGAFHQWGEIKIAAFAVVNALGAVTDRTGSLVRCSPSESWQRLPKVTELMQNVPQSQQNSWHPQDTEDSSSGTTQNTTISLVVTNVKLDYWELQRLAVQVHASMARGIQPLATREDGDTLFAASTQEVDNGAFDSPTLAAMASDTMWDAVLASVPDEKPFVPAEIPTTVDASTLASYSGKYAFGPKAALLVSVAANGNLFATLIGKDYFDLGSADLLPISDTEFYVDARYHTRVTFEKDSSGKVTHAVLNPGLWEQRGTKVSE